MSLQMKNTCEACFQSITEDAYICVHECTFCAPCTNLMEMVCPNCSGELVRRPRKAKPCPIGGAS
ncbi:DUF1272 domain-containing protein [Halobacillus litoralis]|uniref:DUF1272 domain-containing protein n=1 Tax=Halobacillus litoralis TaxID=45668 RepID=UPI001CD77964|nr:DUF1272 domain-containing protein [Halobacillus litoralis]MCA0969335.1 DUF1272 domain-containing protein [Halobacillus litoralis]